MAKMNADFHASLLEVEVELGELEDALELAATTLPQPSPELLAIKSHLMTARAHAGIARKFVIAIAQREIDLSADPSKAT